MLKTLKLIILAAFAMAMIACTKAPHRESAGEYIDSSAITANVKARLMDKLGTKAFAIKVNTYKDVVQLSGFVDNALIKRHAATIAANSVDVRQVRNNLIVK